MIRKYEMEADICSTGASYVHLFDYAARGPLNGDDGDPKINRPVKSVHCDQSYEGAKRVVMSRLPDKAFAEEVVENRRFQIMNVRFIHRRDRSRMLTKLRSHLAPFGTNL